MTTRDVQSSSCSNCLALLADLTAKDHQLATLEAEQARLTKEVERLNGAHEPMIRPYFEQAQAAERRAEAAEAALSRYGSHLTECAKVTRETIDGHMVRVDPWEADKIACTCGFSALQGGTK